MPTDPQLRRYVQALGLPEFALRHGLGERTAQRLYSGAKPASDRLREEFARFPEWEDRADG